MPRETIIIYLTSVELKAIIIKYFKILTPISQTSLIIFSLALLVRIYFQGQELGCLAA